jgi:ribosomal protein S18 acetylase RimI-like enzyme/8-oxo-dGTP pyrophosphatase MutT (NUDIX family)
MNRCVQKVTAFVTRGSGAHLELLLFEHPFAGNQIPAGTVEEGEAPEEAVLREVAEETGLTTLPVRRYLGYTRRKLPDGQRIVWQRTRVYARPDPTSFDWAYLRRGIWVTVDRTERGFSQVTYQEADREPQPQYTTMRITGWVPDAVLADEQIRHFFHCPLIDCSADRGPACSGWTVFADNHRFSPFWAPLDSLPPIISPQDQWLEILHEDLGSPADAESAPCPPFSGSERGLPGLEIRPYEQAHEQAVVRLWRDVFPGAPSWNDPETDIRRKLAVQRDLFLVAALRGEVVGTAMAGYDGHRGWIYYLAVDARCRRQGIGTALVVSVEKRLTDLGCPKLNLQVRATNQGVVGFYRHLGYEPEDRISMGKRLQS